MIEKVSFDTNVLIYSFDNRDMRKHDVAKRIVDACSAAGCMVALQCLNEFFRAVTRKQFLKSEEASAIVDETCGAMRVVLSSELDLRRAITLYDNYRLQFFDALLLATLNRAGCTRCFSEDMQHLQAYGAVQVVNPFALADKELDLLLS